MAYLEEKVKGAEEATQKVDNIQYLLHTQTTRFKKLLHRTKETLTNIGKCGVSISGGKDSQVLLDICQNLNLDAVYFFIDSGAEYPETLDQINFYNQFYKNKIITIEPAITIKEIMKLQGSYGYTNPQNEYYHFTPEEIKAILLRHPTQALRDQSPFNTLLTGLRKEESRARKELLKKGKEQFTKYDQMIHIYPLSDWTYFDIWAYIKVKKLKYNKLYDLSTINDIQHSRVGSYLGMSGLERGRIKELSITHPDIFYKIIQTFPELSTYV